MPQPRVSRRLQAKKEAEAEAARAAEEEEARAVAQGEADRAAVSRKRRKQKPKEEEEEEEEEEDALPKRRKRVKKKKPDVVDLTASSSSSSSNPSPIGIRGMVDPDGERRMASYRASREYEAEARLVRALSQRLFLISQTDEGPEQRRYGVLGSTGNVYRVVIGVMPSCTCPDHRRRKQNCKHLLFVLAKVLKVQMSDPVSWQKALLPAELREMFRRAPPPPADSLAESAVRQAYSNVTGERAIADDAAGKGEAEDQVEGEEEGEEDDDDGSGAKRKDWVGTDCAICFEEFEEKDAKQTVWCQASCGQTLHAGCWTQWRNHKGAGATCPYCRSSFEKQKAPPAAAGAGGAAMAGVRSLGGYMNLASLSSQHPDNPRSNSYFYGGYRRRPYGGGRRGYNRY